MKNTYPKNTFSRTSDRCPSAFGSLLLCLLLLPALASAVESPEPPPAEPPPEAIRTDSGLATVVLREGKGFAKPDSNDMVSTNFSAYTPAGYRFQTNLTGAESDKPAVFHLDQVFAGFAEGLQLMVEGEQRRLWIPAHLGPPNPKSGPRGASVIDVELLAVRPIPNPPSDLGTPPSDAVRLVGGAFSKQVREGWGEERPDPDGGVMVTYTGWTSDGRVFDSSVRRGRPTVFPLGKVMPAFGDALLEMVEGEKRYLWIPAELAEGNWIGSPKGNLTFEVEVNGLISPETFRAIPEGAERGGSISVDG